MSINDIVRILKQRLFLIISIWILVLAATVGLTIYLVKYHSLYRASAYILVESPTPRAPMQFVQPMVHVDLMDRFVQDQVIRLTEVQFLQDVLRDADVRETEWFQSAVQEHGEGAAIGELLKELEDGLHVRQVKGSSYIKIAFRTRSIADAPKIVNTLVEKFLAQVRVESRESYEDELNEYEQKASTLEEEVDSLRAQKESFIGTQIAVPGVTQGLNVIGETWRALSAEVTRITAERLQYKAAYDNLLGTDASEIAVSPETRMMIDRDPEVAGLQQMIVPLENRLMLLRQQLGENHRQVEATRAELEVLENQLSEARQAKMQEVREYQINSARTMWQNAIQAELQLRDRMQEYEWQQRDLDRSLAGFQTLEEQQFMKEEQLTRIRDYVMQLEMLVSASGMVRVRGAGQAIPPRERNFPRWEMNLPAGFVIGGMLSIGLALLLELVDNSIKTSRDIARHVHVPILGTVPDVDDEEVDIDVVELAAHTSPRSMIAEAFRNIRTNLLLSSPAEQQRTILVTSPKPEDGKTSVAANLAISLAQSGRRILLVDANFHRPRLGELFKTDGDHGLSNVLIDQGQIQELATRTELPNLDVLGSGPIPPNPSELLSTQYLQPVITRALEHYDQIIFDAPPVLLMSDVLVMTGSVDGVVLICRAKSSSRGVAARAREQLDRVEARIFGAVLNAAQVTRGGYFREQIRSYYDYQPGQALTSSSSRALDQQPPDKT
jgi:capsular exopolysaccharide synthesis family protein